MENYPNAPRDMLPTLAILGIDKTESSKPQTQPQESKPVRCSRKRVGTPLFITVSRHGRVKYLPKEARHLSRSDTTYLKERYLRVLDGYEDIERFDYFFAETSALERCYSSMRDKKEKIWFLSFCFFHSLFEYF